MNEPSSLTTGAGEAAPDDVVSASQAAAWAGVSRSVIGYWIRRGRVPTIRRGNQNYVHLADVAAAQAAAHAGEVVPLWREDKLRAGQRLRALREGAGLSQLSLAAASGLTHEAISRMEHGAWAPNGATVRQLAEALGVAPERFVSYDELGLQMLTAAEAAYRLDIPLGRFRRWLRQDVIAAGKVSGHWRIPAIAVAELGRSGRLRGESRRLDPRYPGNRT